VDYGHNILNLAAFMKDTRMVGPGLRDAIWVQGCSIKCPGCANQAYQPHEKRVLMSVERILAHLSSRKEKIDGITILGGEPTEQPEPVGKLLQGGKALGFSTVVFTGRLYEDLKEDSTYRKILDNTDLLIDGPFIINEQDCNLHWYGSKNQRLICLSDYWKDIHNFPVELDEPNGEIILSNTESIFHGVGTQQIIMRNTTRLC
jgi:anaerobic ribonucleoside-triphosphate reductase activating protein